MICILPIRHGFRCLVVLSLLAAAGPVRAIESICLLADGNLYGALQSASNQYYPKRILLSQGTYNIGDLQNSWFPLAPGTSIEGGYSDNCTQRQIGAGNTVVSATQTYGLFIYPMGDLLIEGLTFDITGGVSVGTTPYTASTSGSRITINRNVFRQSHLSVAIDNYADFNAGVSIVDSLFHDNTAADNGCVLELLTTGASADYTLVNNTVVDNNGAGVCMLNHTDVDDNLGDGTLFAYNNIFYNNPGADLFTNTANLELKWNTIGTFSGPAPTTEQFTQHGDPKLDAQYRPITSPLSPGINSGAFDGNPDLPLHDLDGGPRVVGTRVDRGAYESNVDDSYLLKVKNTDNSGTDSLRAAIVSANANGGGLISFEIPGGCSPAQVIHLTSGLPAIAAPIIINGFSQIGASPNTLDVGDDAEICVVLDGGNTVGNGLLVNASPPANTQLTVLGLGFSGFVDAAINLSGGSGHGVQGTHMGGKVNGVTLAPSGYGIYLAAGANNVAIGGDYASNRNIIGAAKLDGIFLQGPANSRPAATANTIKNNYVGIGWNGLFVAHGNTGDGIHVSGSNNEISSNVVGFSGSDGIDLDGTAATGNVVEHNAVGTGTADPFTDSDIGNGAFGVLVENAAHDNKIRFNAIADNSSGGVRVLTGRGNTIRFNNIFSNDGNGGLGIDLFVSGPDPIDDDSAALLLQANRGLNAPALTQAAEIPQIYAVVKGRLTTTPGTYFVDIYADPTCSSSGFGEGRFWLGSGKTTIGPSATYADFSISVDTSYVPPGWLITATATDTSTNASPGNTSEFSACKVLTNDRIFSSGFDPSI